MQKTDEKSTIEASIFEKYSQADQLLWFYANGSKPDAPAMLAQLLGVKWQTLNAEQILKEKEPTQAQAAIDFKLSIGDNMVFLERLSQELTVLPATMILAILASDVEYINPMGVRQLKLERTGELTEAQVLAEVINIAQSFEANDDGHIFVSWLITFGLKLFVHTFAEDKNQSRQVIEQTPANTLTLEVTAAVTTPPTAEQVKARFNPGLSPGFDLIEFLKETNQLDDLTITLQDPPPTAMEFTKIDMQDIPSLAVLLVAHKVLPSWMFAQLVAATINQH